MTSLTKQANAGALLGILLLGCGSEAKQTCEAQEGVVCVWAGSGALGFNGDHLDRRESHLYWPVDLTFAPNGDGWVLDWNNHLIRKVGADDTFVTVVGSFFPGDGPEDQSDLMLPGAPGDTVGLNHPSDLEFGPDGKLYFAAWHNHKIRSVDPETGLVHVMCGKGAGFAGDGASAAMALFSQPKAIAIDLTGAMYVLDQRNFRVRKIGAGTDPIIETIVGIGTAGFSGDEGPAAEAQLNFESGGNPEPSGALALGPDGHLYLSDGLNHRIRRVNLTSQIITTIAGTGEPGFGGDGGLATKARLNNVRDLEFGPDGKLYVADTENHRIRAIDLNTGIIDTIVGTGKAGENGDGLAADQIMLNRPFGIAFDAEGALFIADTFNSRILKVSP